MRRGVRARRREGCAGVAQRRESRCRAGAAPGRGARSDRKYVADLVRAEDAARMVDEVERDLGPIDVLVNSAGAARRYAPADLDAAAWHAAMDAKYFSYIHPIAAVLPRMAARGRGSDRQHHRLGRQGRESRAPAGRRRERRAHARDRGLAAAFAPKGIRINGINPGATLTGRVQEGLAVEAKMTGLARGGAAARMQARIPLGPPRHAGGGRAGRAVSRLDPRELCNGRDRAHGRRSEPGHLNAAGRPRRAGSTSRTR